MPKVLVSDPIAEAGIARLREVAEVDVKTGLKPDELLSIIGEYDALAVRSETKVTAEILAAAGNLKIIGRAGVGVDNIDVKAATEKGVVVVNSPEGNTLAAAELTVAMLLSLARNISAADASMRAGRWDRKKFLGTEVYGKTLGVVGLGKIGSEVARRARAFEMEVIAYDPFTTEEKAGELGARLVSLDDIYRQSDFITLHLPLNDQTRGMIAAPQFAIMKDGVRIVNCARGGLVDEAALAEALTAGKVGGAAFDVFSKEPMPEDNPLRNAPNTVLTPHLGASTEEAQVNVAIDIAEQIADYLEGKPARAAVNMPSLSSEALALARPWLTLGEKIGSLHTQLAASADGSRAAEQVEVLFQGEFGEMPTGPVTRSVMAGLLTPVLSDPVNLVNAPVLAQQRGIRVTESRSTTPAEYSAMLTVKVMTGAGERTICGAVFGQNDVRIVHIDRYRVDVPTSGHMIITRHKDRPGIIGGAGMLLGEAGVNIAGMNVGRMETGGQALMVLLVDEPVSDEIMGRIRAMEGLDTAQLVKL
jgi:D-3-phosphoglycerate dehydrogenase